MDKKATQRALIARRLSDDGVVSAHEMTYTYGITRTAARIAELRAIGWLIRTERKRGEMAFYWLVAR